MLEVGANAIMFSAEGFERTTLSAANREKIAHGNAERLLRTN